MSPESHQFKPRPPLPPSSRPTYTRPHLIAANQRPIKSHPANASLVRLWRVPPAPETGEGGLTLCLLVFSPSPPSPSSSAYAEETEEGRGESWGRLQSKEDALYSLSSLCSPLPLPPSRFHTTFSHIPSAPFPSATTPLRLSPPPSYIFNPPHACTHPFLLSFCTSHSSPFFTSPPPPGKSAEVVFFRALFYSTHETKAGNQ